MKRRSSDGGGEKVKKGGGGGQPKRGQWNVAAQQFTLATESWLALGGSREGSMQPLRRRGPAASRESDSGGDALRKATSLCLRGPVYLQGASTAMPCRKNRKTENQKTRKTNALPSSRQAGSSGQPPLALGVGAVAGRAHTDRPTPCTDHPGTNVSPSVHSSGRAVSQQDGVLVVGTNAGRGNAHWK